MQTMIYNPLDEYVHNFKEKHLQNATAFFEELVAKSNVNIQENQQTIQQRENVLAVLKKRKRSIGWWKFLRVLCCITILLIPLVVMKITPIIRNLRNEIMKLEQEENELFALAQRQMQPLNDLFTDRDALTIAQTTLPMLSFAPNFSVEQEMDMITNYDFCDHTDNEQSTLEVLAGRYNDNPFLFQKKLRREMGVELYHGYKTIFWTETYRDNNGRIQTRTRSQVLHATVTKPKPFYKTQVILSYCAQGAPELSFTRDATNLDEKNDREIERYIKKGEKKLKKLTDKAVKENKDFVSMSNTDFEVLFDALDRTNEVQFRTLFTPLAQTNMTDLIRSQEGYGDDFNFIKRNRTNTIITQHSQGRPITLSPSHYQSHSFDVIKQNFINGNLNFFKAMYFDFAPIWAIPIYQERPVHSLDPVSPYPHHYTYKECEVLANCLQSDQVAHPQSKTRCILKTSFLQSKKGVDEICVTAHSYDIISRMDFIPTLGGDGRWHSVPVAWDDYIPLIHNSNFFVATEELAKDHTAMARRNHLQIFNEL